MDIPKARLKLEEAQFFYRTLRRYLYDDSGLHMNDALGLKRAGFHLSAFANAVDSVFEVIKKRYKLAPEQYEAWLSNAAEEADRTQRRKEMNDLRNREVHDAEVVMREREANPPAPQPARLPIPRIASDAWEGGPLPSVWAPTLSSPSTWAHGRDVLDVCDEYLRLADDYIRWCEALKE